MKILSNVSFRVVGLCLRVNDAPYQPSSDPSEIGSIDIPELEVANERPILVDVMHAISHELDRRGYCFEFNLNSPILSDMMFAKRGARGWQHRLDSERMRNPVRFYEWRYFLYDKAAGNSVPQRLVASQSAAYNDRLSCPEIRDNYSVVWRLLPGTTKRSGKQLTEHRCENLAGGLPAPNWDPRVPYRDPQDTGDAGLRLRPRRASMLAAREQRVPGKFSLVQ